MCNAGNPVTQLIIPCTCFAICYAAFEEPHTPRWILFVLFFTPLALGFHYTIIVHSEGYTGNPRSINRAIRSLQRSNLQQIKLYYDYAFQDRPAVLSSNYPPGPLAASGAWQVLVDRIADSEEKEKVDDLLTSKEYHTHWLWHTWLTGIYGVSSRPLKLWYPGGKLKDAVQQLEYR